MELGSTWGAPVTNTSNTATLGTVPGQMRGVILMSAVDLAARFCADFRNLKANLPQSLGIVPSPCPATVGWVEGWFSYQDRRGAGRTFILKRQNELRRGLAAWILETMAGHLHYNCGPRCP
jgi:hypothetical protein